MGKRAIRNVRFCKREFISRRLQRSSLLPQRLALVPTTMEYMRYLNAALGGSVVYDVIVDWKFSSTGLNLARIKSNLRLSSQQREHCIKTLMQMISVPNTVFGDVPPDFGKIPSSLARHTETYH